LAAIQLFFLSLQNNSGARTEVEVIFKGTKKKMGVCSKKNCCASWDPKRKVILLADGHTFARGLTKTIAATFSPQFSVSVTLQGVPKIKNKKRGKWMGNCIDYQLTEWVTTGKLPTNPNEKLVKIQATLAEHKWTPVSSQLTLGCSVLRLGTKIDLLCQTEDDEIVIIELKCGFDDYYDVSNQGNMEYPFEHIQTSFRSKHYLQLWLTQWLFQHCPHEFSDRKIAGSYILRIFENETSEVVSEVIPLPEWLNDDELLDKCLAILQSTKHMTSKKRNRVLMNGSQRSRYKFVTKKRNKDTAVS
jgi:hypothetical protein